MNSPLIDDLADLLGPATADPPPLTPVQPASPSLTHATTEKPSAVRISEADLADLLGVTPRRVRQLAGDGVIPKVARGALAFDRRDSARAYCAWLREKASRGVAIMDELKEEKIRQAREAADKLALQNAAARGELVPASDVESAWAGILRDVRAMMLAVPSRCGATLPHLTSHDVAAIEGEIKAALRGLADDA